LRQLPHTTSQTGRGSVAPLPGYRPRPGQPGSQRGNGENARESVSVPTAGAWRLGATVAETERRRGFPLPTTGQDGIMTFLKKFATSNL